jgi:hypothetical protein
MPENNNSTQSTFSTKHPRLIKVLKIVGIIIAGLIALRLIWLLLTALVSLVMGVLGWLYRLVINIGAFVLFCWIMYAIMFSPKAKAHDKKRKAKADKWQADQLARLGIGNHPQNNGMDRRQETYSRHVYDERDGVYRDVNVDRGGNVVGGSGHVDGDNLKH